MTYYWFPHASNQVNEGGHTVHQNRRGPKGTMWWVAFGNDVTSYVDITQHERGDCAVFGCFVQLVMIASRAKPAWYLIDHLKRPHTIETLAMYLGLPAELVTRTVQLLMEIDWLRETSSITSNAPSDAPERRSYCQ